MVESKVAVKLVSEVLRAENATLVIRLISSGGRYGVLGNEFDETGVDSAIIEDLQEATGAGASGPGPARFYL